MALTAFTDGQIVHAADLNGVGVRAHCTTALQSVATATFANIVFNTVDEDPDGGFNTSTGLYTVASAGLWIFTATVAWDTNATGLRWLVLTGLPGLSTTPVIQTSAVMDSNGRLTLSAQARCAVGTVVGAQGAQYSGGALNVNAANGVVSFAGALLAR